MADIKQIQVGSTTYDVRDSHLASTDTSSKIYLMGATSQASGSVQTYSDNEVYATSGALTTKSVAVGGGSCTLQYDSTNNCVNFVFS